jgi:hypothetical protein
MKFLEIPPKIVTFKGCEKLAFSAYPSMSVGEGAYIITYPKEVEADFLAPTLHELSHIMQMEVSGGLPMLRNIYKSSKKIELEADYLTGVIFSNVFPQAQLHEFEQNILLTGMYVESDLTAHGTPDQRIVAFRLGVFGESPNEKEGIRDKSKNFRENLYGQFF